MPSYNQGSLHRRYTYFEWHHKFIQHIQQIFFGNPKLFLT